MVNVAGACVNLGKAQPQPEQPGQAQLVLAVNLGQAQLVLAVNLGQARRNVARGEKW